MQRRIMVTGGAGFLGSNLCASLVKNPEDKIYCIDNLCTGKLSNIEKLRDYTNFEFINHDVQNYLNLAVDEIYNAACPASPKAYQESPTNTTKTCVLGAINMLELAKNYDATFLQFSTSEIYGDPQIHPQVELYRGNVNPIGIRSCYDEGKRCVESLCFDYAREFHVNSKVVRIFNTYGPLMAVDDGRVVSNFIVQALKNENVTIYGIGKQTRSFCFVDDLIDALIRMMNKKNFSGPVNLGNPHEFTMLELAEKVISLTGSTSKIIFKPLPEDDPTQRKPDISLAGKELGGWEPHTTIDEGLQRTIEYFDQII